MKEMRKGKHAAGRALALMVLLAAGATTVAEQVQHLSITQPGGMPGWPILTGIQASNYVATISWDGPSGYYQLYQSTNLTNPTWQKFGSPNLNRTTNFTVLQSNIFFKVSGPSPQYAGAKVCLECHPSIHTTESLTPHSRAFSSPAFAAAGGQTNSSCLPCHTVGYGLPTGFKSATDFRSTNRLAGVQCENCHGPAANHAANEMDLTARPRVDIAAQVCGGCHDGPHNPTFSEWDSSAHATMTEDMSSAGRINSCGRCHSGSVRLAMFSGAPPTVTAMMTNDANVPITCAVCHDPHAQHVWTNVMSGAVITNQVRYPLASTNDFFAGWATNITATVTNITPASTNIYGIYDINVCAQCHNDRGANWKLDTSRAPHHSVQYSLLLGSIGELQTGSATTNRSPGAHAGFPESAEWSIPGTYYLTNQCVSCHMPKDPAPAVTHSHRFTLDAYTACLPCHPVTPEKLVPLIMFPAVSNRVYNVKRQLDTWANTVANPAIRTNGILAWEYTNPGGLDWQTNNGVITGWIIRDAVAFKGPNTAGQGLVTDPIKMARFNLYLVLNDGSYGAHNPQFALRLLDAAYYYVVQELFQ